MKHILMIAYGGGHANILRTLYPVLHGAGRFRITILALTAAPLIYRRSGIPFTTLSEFIRILPDWSDLCGCNRERWLPYHNSALGLDEADTIVYYGIGYHDLVARYGETEAEAMFQQYGRKAFLPIETMERLLAAYAPDVVVVTTSPRFEQAAGLAANRLKIPVVRINDLPIMTSYSFDAELCVMNEWAKRYAVERLHVPESRIHVTGQPVFDEELAYSPDQVSAFRREQLGDQYHRLAVYFTRNGWDESTELRTLDELSPAFPNTRFVIKLHPNQTLESVYTPQSHNTIVSRGDAGLYAAVCDLAMTAFSTTGLEAALLDKPVIEVNFSGVSYEMSFSEMGIACLARNPAELGNLIGRLIDPESAESQDLAWSRSAFQTCGHAADNISRLIEICACREVVA